MGWGGLARPIGLEPMTDRLEGGLMFYKSVTVYGL